MNSSIFMSLRSVLRGLSGIEKYEKSPGLADVGLRKTLMPAATGLK